MTATTVRQDRVGHTLVLTIDRPEARNAVDANTARQIGEALDEADRDPSTWAIVLTGAGDRAFCAGADLKSIMRGEPLYPEGLEHWGFAGWCSHYVATPTIVAANGLALGGGTEIVLAADLAVADENARFGLPEVARGLIAAAGGAFRLPRQVPLKAAMEMMLTGEPIDAQRALELNLINAVAPAGTVLDRALELAEKICRNSPTAVQASKRVAHLAAEGTWGDEAEAWAYLRAENAAVRSSPDGIEGPRAFAEKRAPIWQGS